MTVKKTDNSTPRPPIVVVMGHIDHGKTTLLDYIRKTKVTECEAGGITQHVGAYEVEVKSKQGALNKITFLDTPGHESFSKIRERGAKIADIAILMVAADDKVNIQTEESIKTIKESGIPFIVAINKIDKESANPEKIKKELSEKEIYLEEWGGKIPSINISAQTGQGIDELLEMILLVSEMEELKTNNENDASGFVVESNMDPKRGASATLVIQNGILKQGMFVVAEKSISPVRIFENCQKKSVKEASASSPVKITGFNHLPQAGTEFKSYNKKKEAEKAAAEFRATLEKNIMTETKPISSNESVGAPVQKISIVHLIIKTDAIGSKEAIEKEIAKIREERVELKILYSGVGDINENDAKLASSAENSTIIGFNVNCAEAAKSTAEKFGTEIKIFDIIYEAEKWLKEKTSALTKASADKEERIIGKAKILKIFRNEKSKKIIGGDVLSGIMKKNAEVKIYRRDFLLGTGKITELQQNKNNQDEIPEGQQFGALIQTKAEIATKDTLDIIGKGNEV